MTIIHATHFASLGCLDSQIVESKWNWRGHSQDLENRTCLPFWNASRVQTHLLEWYNLTPSFSFPFLGSEKNLGADAPVFLPKNRTDQWTFVFREGTACIPFVFGDPFLKKRRYTKIAMASRRRTTPNDPRAIPTIAPVSKPSSESGSCNKNWIEF